MRRRFLHSLRTRSFSSCPQLNKLQPDTSQSVSFGRLAPSPTSRLWDRHGREHTYLRISLTERCNFRCTYCMPENGVDLTPDQDLLSVDEILRVASAFVREGVTKIRLTGGEPLVRRDIGDIVAALQTLRPLGLDSIHMTTNGLLLKRRMPQLLQAGFDGNVNVSVDSLDAVKFGAITRQTDRALPRVLDGIRTSAKQGVTVRINCVVVRDQNDHEIVDFARLARDEPIGVRFIEYMPFDGNRWDSRKLVSLTEMLHRIGSEFPGLQAAPELDGPHATTKSFRCPDWRGHISVISSMTKHFCGDCNRVRLTADGSFKTCLFGEDELSIRDLIREGVSDDELLDAVSDSLQLKKANHGGMFSIAERTKRPMTTIGG